MKVVQWNLSKKTQPMYGVKRYEDELYAHINEIGVGKGVELERMQRTRNTVAAWFSDYRVHEADVVHATCQTLAPAAFINRPRRFVVTVLDLIPLVFPSVIERDLSYRIQWSVTPKALKKADRLIAISEFTKGEIVALLGIDKSKISVTPLAVDRKKYYPKDKSVSRKKFNLKEDRKYILVVASNLEHKRMDIVEEVFNSIREKRKDIGLIKAGYAHKLTGEGIENIGYVSEDNMPDLYNSADVFINTSSYETGLPVLEAMSCGVPTVVSSNDSNLEIVGQRGQTVDINADNAIEQYVDKILSCIYAGKDDSAIERSKSFSWERMAEETIKVYEDVYNTVV